MISEQALKQSYAECARVCKASASSFPWLFKLLPVEQRMAMNAVYAYCRVIDDSVDNGTDISAKRIAFEQVTGNLTMALAGEVIGSIYPAVVATIQKNHLPVEIFHLLAKGMESDLNTEPIRTEADMLIYCDRVAGTVGKMVIGICGVIGSDGDKYAFATGRALQLTNILRDVREDYAKYNRCYIPSNWLQQHGVSPHDFLTDPVSDNVKTVLKAVGDLAEKWYTETETALPPNYQKQLRFAEALRSVYYTLFERMRATGFNPAKRVSLSTGDKMGMTLKLIKTMRFS